MMTDFLFKGTYGQVGHFSWGWRFKTLTMASLARCPVRISGTFNQQSLRLVKRENNYEWRR
jgi:hypothetical protein